MPLEKPFLRKQESEVERAPDLSGASGIRWDLSNLYTSIGDPDLARDQESAGRLAADFREQFEGRIKAKEVSAEFIARSLQRYEELLEVAYKPVVYARLLHAADSGNAEHGALLASTQESFTAIQTTVMFYELDWIALPDEAAAALIRSPECSKWKHFLEQLRVFKHHTLAEPQEIILAEKGVTGVSAFRRLFDEITSGMEFEIEMAGRPTKMTQSEALSLLYHPDRAAREEAHRGFTAGLEKTSHLATFILNTTVKDHAVDCRLRGYSNPAQPRHLSNEITHESFENLVLAVERRADIVRDYYELKRKLLGVDKLYDFDRYAPVEVEGVSVPTSSWGEAIEVVRDSYHQFSAELGAIVDQFLSGRWVDAEIRPGKRGGAFCSAAVPSVHPYILVNFGGRLSDTMTLAHELGHGVHQYLSRSRGILQLSTPLTLAETASVFGEMLVFDRILQDQNDAPSRLALLCHKLEDSFATVFRQVVLTRFEQEVHSARGERELVTEDFDALWMEANAPLHGAAVELTPEYRRWWTYIGHFVHTPFYCYAYSFGELMVLALWNRYRQEGQAFVPRYLELLSAGGTDTPENLIGQVGLNLNDPDFWDSGLDILAEMLADAERTAEQVLGGSV